MHRGGQRGSQVSSVAVQNMQKPHPCSVQHTCSSSQSDQSGQTCLLSSSGVLTSPCCSLPLYAEQIETIFCKRYCQCLRTQVNKGRETCLLYCLPLPAATWTGKKQDKNPRNNICNCLYPFSSHLFLSDLNDVASGQSV